MTAGTGARDLGDGIYQLPTDYPEVCNAPLWTYMIADGDVFGLVDPGITSTLEATLGAAIAEVGYSVGRASLLLATHGHPDHSGGQGSWGSAAPGARIAAPLEDTPWVESFDKQWTRFWDDYPGVMDLRDDRRSLAGLCVPEPRVDVLLRDGDAVAVSSRELTVIETRGHTWGHCAYFDEASGALFTGDAVQGHGAPNCDGRSVFAPLYLDVAEARWGLQRLLDVPFRLLCPAHFPPMPRDEGLAFLHDSLSYIDTADRIARELAADSGSAPLLTRDLAARLGEAAGTRPPVSPQTVATARAHLYALAREGLLEAAWVRGTTG